MLLFSQVNAIMPCVVYNNTDCGLESSQFYIGKSSVFIVTKDF